MSLLTTLALAAPVQCDPLEASRIREEAHIDEGGAPRTHPWLVPGLARASSSHDSALRDALEDLCASGGELSVTPTAHWETAAWSAHTVRLTRSEMRECILSERSIHLTVGSRPGAATHYALQSTLPLSQTPVGDCDASARWREEKELAGDSGPVRLVLATLREDARVLESEVLLRRATADGWHEQQLAAPAPDRLVDGFEGPRFALNRMDDDWIAVQTQGRSGSSSSCTPSSGQVAWTWTGQTWTRHETDEARSLLAQYGLWRLAGDPGWLLILAQDTDTDRELLESRARRLRRRNPGTLLVLESARFPELNAGFVVVAPPPFATRASADAARLEWGRRSRSYVKRAWPPPDPCSAP